MIDYRYFINKFPKIELSYDTILHNKVQADWYMLIPDGIKVFVWFTYYKNRNICVIMHLNKYNIITKVEDTVLSFDKNLSYGTIIYGTYFTIDKINYITCEDIYYYKGDNIYEDNYDTYKKYIERVKLLKNLFDNEVRQVLYTNKSVILGLPYICSRLKEAFLNIKIMPYNVKGILCRYYNDCDKIGIILNKESKQIEVVFKVKADIESDIYNLYCNDSRNEFYNIACIPDYKTSVMMNNHFRIIKENKNLDFLEESDEDEEFENINEDKYVNLKKVLYMKCIFIKKFSKWKPVECVKFGEKLLTKREIYELEKSK